MPEQTLQKIDHNAIRTNQIIVIILNITAFIFDQPWLAAIVALVMLTGVLRGKPGFDFVYKLILLPTKVIKPNILNDHAEPHQFAQLLGGIFTGVGAVLLLIQIIIPGWILIWLVVALAALNAFGGFCVGCAIYYWLGRFIIPGFSKTPPDGTIPGRKPER